MSGNLGSNGGTPQPPVNPNLFNQIPMNILVPGNYYEADPLYSNTGLLEFPAKIVIFAQKTAAGTATALKIYPLLSPAQATNLCGAGSIGEGQCLAVLATKPTIPFYLICVADAAGSNAATGKFIVGGNWSTSGVLPLYIAGVRIEVPVAATDSAVDVAANAAALIQEVSMPSLPVTAAQGGAGQTSQVLLTAVNAGSEGNSIHLAVAAGPNDMLPAGMTCATGGSGGMSGGTINPNITQIIDVIGSIWYTDIIQPWSDAANLLALATELDNRFNAMAGLDAYSYATLYGSYGQILTAKAAMNSRFRSTLAITNPPTPPWIMTAAMGARAAQSTFNDPSKQCRGLVLPGVVAPHASDRYTWEEQQLLLGNGLCTFDVLTDGTVVLQRLVSENLTDNTGTLTTAWQDINAAKVATRIRYDWKAYVNLTYPSNKLADDGSLAAEYDPTVATPNRMQGSWAARCNVYGKAGWIEDVQNQVRSSNFSIDANNKNRMNATQPYTRVGNLMVLAGALQFNV
jgi:phage tail sheath gpL-like